MTSLVVFLGIVKQLSHRLGGAYGRREAGGPHGSKHM